MSPPQHPAAGCRSERLEIHSRSPGEAEPVRPDGRVVDWWVVNSGS